MPFYGLNPARRPEGYTVKVASRHVVTIEAAVHNHTGKARGISRFREKAVAHSNHFSICNDFSGTLLLAIEPEGAVVPLVEGEEVRVSEQFDSIPVTLNVSLSAEGYPLIAIWPGDGTLLAEKNGVNLLDLG